MRVGEQAKAEDHIGLGIALAVTGLYFVFAAFGVLPLPESGAEAPAFIIALAGAAFVFAGCSVAIRGRAGARDSDADLPADAPRWTKLSYRVFGIAIAGTLALIGTWIAIGSGPRAFSIDGSLVSGTAGQALGRTVFGLGAVIVWIYVLALTVGTVRKLFDRNRR